MSATQHTVESVFKKGRCGCNHCQRSRAIDRIRDLLPEAESQELENIYHALLDEAEDLAMRLYSAEKKNQT